MEFMALQKLPVKLITEGAETRNVKTAQLLIGLGNGSCK